LIGATGSDSFTFTLTQGGEVSAAQTATITLPAAAVVVPPVVLTGFSITPVAGSNLATYHGGTVEQCATDAAADSVTSIAVTVDGAYIIHVVGAPTFVNAAFAAHFVLEVPAGTIVLLEV